MEFIVVDGTTLAKITASSKAQAATIYSSSRLPSNCKMRQFRLKVLQLNEAAVFNCLVTRSNDAIETVAKEAP